jgi:hypothetical protein
MTNQPVAVYDTYKIEDGVCKFEERIAKATFAGARWRAGEINRQLDK